MKLKKVALIGSVSYLSVVGTLCYGFLIQEPLQQRTELKTTLKEQVIAELVKDKHLSVVIAKKRYAYTIAAIKKVESDVNGPLTTGDDGESKGMYQVQEKHWSKVPETIEGQTDQCSQILESLLKERPYQQAIARYNGSGKQALQYSKRVVALVKEMEHRERVLRDLQTQLERKQNGKG